MPCTSSTRTRFRPLWHDTHQKRNLVPNFFLLLYTISTGALHPRFSIRHEGQVASCCCCPPPPSPDKYCCFFLDAAAPFFLSSSIAYGRMERRRRRIQDGRIRSCFENDQIFKVATDKAVDEERVIAAYAWREEAERGKEKRPEALVFPSCVTVPPSFQQRATVTRNPEGMDVSYPPIFPLNPLSSDPPFEQTSENRAL